MWTRIFTHLFSIHCFHLFLESTIFTNSTWSIWCTVQLNLERVTRKSYKKTLTLKKKCSTLSHISCLLITESLLLNLSFHILQPKKWGGVNSQIQTAKRIKRSESKKETEVSSLGTHPLPEDTPSLTVTTPLIPLPHAWSVPRRHGSVICNKIQSYEIPSTTSWLRPSLSLSSHQTYTWFPLPSIIPAFILPFLLSSHAPCCNYVLCLFFSSQKSYSSDPPHPPSPPLPLLLQYLSTPFFPHLHATLPFPLSRSPPLQPSPARWVYFSRSPGHSGSPSDCVWRFPGTPVSLYRHLACGRQFRDRDVNSNVREAFLVATSRSIFFMWKLT